MPILHTRRTFHTPAQVNAIMADGGAMKVVHTLKPEQDQLTILRRKAHQMSVLAARKLAEFKLGKATLAELKHANQCNANAVRELEAFAPQALPSRQRDTKSLYGR